MFVSDGYPLADLPVFRRHVRDAVARLQATSPFREDWSSINVHRVELPSQAPGVAGGRGGPSPLRTRVPTLARGPRHRHDERPLPVLTPDAVTGTE